MDVTLKNKEELVEGEYNKCKAIIEKSLSSHNYEKAMAAISISGHLLYSWNQRYTDDYLEDSLKKVAESTIIDRLGYEPQKGTVLFYDGFGLDVRGLALIYLKALVNNNYHVIYVTNKSAENNQPEIDKVLNNNVSEKKYLASHKHLKRMRELQRIVVDKKPQYAFLYTTPNDSSGITVFMQMKSTKRYQINLTDHAFWLGTNAFDYCIEFRNYGTSISALHRHIPVEKLRIVPFYPIIDKDREFSGFTFETEGKQIIFSGGSVYKTVDKSNTYYILIDKILESCGDAIFVYASNEENERLKDMSLKYPGRVHQIQERSDLYQCMRHCTLYLNTYPLLGGLMTQYAVMAERIPLTLQYDISSEGLLVDQENRGVFYNNADELIRDAIRLLQDKEYLNQRTKLIKGSVISPAEFDKEVHSLLKNNMTSYSVEIKPRDIKNFQSGYVERFDMDESLRGAVGLSNISLFKEYKDIYIDKIMRGGITKIIQKIFMKFPS